jgi:hypothetical protein
MQTFVPSTDFTECAEVLDRQRLGKQRVECLQILRALHGLTRGWRNHPATRMWAGHENALCEYAFSMCDEWVRRGYVDGCREKIAALRVPGEDCIMPPWWGGPIHTSHRSSLLKRLPDWYGQFNWTEQPSSDPLFWPVSLLTTGGAA